MPYYSHYVTLENKYATQENGVLDRINKGRFSRCCEALLLFLNILIYLYKSTPVD